MDPSRVETEQSEYPRELTLLSQRYTTQVVCDASLTHCYQLHCHFNYSLMLIAYSSLRVSGARRRDSCW